MQTSHTTVHTQEERVTHRHKEGSLVARLSPTLHGASGLARLAILPSGRAVVMGA